MTWARCPSALAAVFALMLLIAAGCSSDKEEFVEKPVGELYNQAQSALEEGEYKRAAKAFDEVERQHPYSPWAVRAQLMTGYAYYLDNAYDDAILALDRFIDLHPADPNVPYAYYLRGLSYYEQISDPSRDQGMTRKAKEAFEELVSRFPDTQYARDARIKLDLTMDHLAASEMVVGRFYLKRQFYIAAINRFRTVVEVYDRTTQVPEALLRLTEAYMSLGLVDEAVKAASVLGYNFPDTDWYEDAYELVRPYASRKPPRAGASG